MTDTNNQKILGYEPEALTIGDLVHIRAANGDKPLYIIRDEVLTYKDAERRSNEVANSLIKLGIKKGDVVATFMYNCVSQALIWFGCAKIGAIYAPLNVSLERDDLAYSLNDTDATIFVLEEELAPAFNACQDKLNISPLVYVCGSVSSVSGNTALPLDQLFGGNVEFPDIEVNPNDPATITYTGGSTSMPKGVLSTHLSHIAAAIRYGEVSEASASDIGYANSHFFHIGGQQFGVIGPLFFGMTGIMEKWFSVSRYLDVVRRYSVTIIDPVGTMLAALMSLPDSLEDKNHNVRVGIGIASGQVRREVRDGFETRFGIPLLEVYSMTEMGVLLCSQRMSDRRQGSCGHTYGWGEICIVDQNDNPVPAGTTGQILLRPNVNNTSMIRYVNKDEETIAAWKNFWYHTGDIGKLDQDGFVYYVGREAHWIRRGGENISAFEVEKIITSHPNVADCAVVGVPADLGEEDIKAYVQLNESEANIDPSDLIKYWQDRVAFFKVPRYIEFVDHFPRSATKNEILRHQLREQGVGNCWDKKVV